MGGGGELFPRSSIKGVNTYIMKDEIKKLEERLAEMRLEYPKAFPGRKQWLIRGANLLKDRIKQLERNIEIKEEKNEGNSLF